MKISQNGSPTSFLLIGPYDPLCGEYTFLAPPLGVWRLQGVLSAAGYRAEVFDPNCCEGPPAEALRALVGQGCWDVIGVSTTGMTLRYDLELAHLARRASPRSALVAGGMEATFEPQLMFEIGPFDYVVLGEGERPLLEMAARIQRNASLDGIAGTARVAGDGELESIPQAALLPHELRDSIFKTPYERMPYRSYWEHLEAAYQVDCLPVKAQREARLAEIRSVRLITLNYCPMACTFCSSTNFLHAAQGSVARVRRLEADECLAMIRRIVEAHPDVRTVIFQDDIFVFTSDDRILPLCEGIVAAKRRDEIPPDLQFISTNRIDAMTPERLAAMYAAGFRVLGFGVESFSLPILEEFNKKQIYTHIDPVLREALRLGITPFLDLILTSPRSTLEDLAASLRRAYQWCLKGCEMGMYPYVIPFSGAAMARDPSLLPYTVTTRQRVEGTEIEWEQPTKILPVDRSLRTAILAIEEEFERNLARLETSVAHLPSRLRSLLWVACAAPVLTERGLRVPSSREAWRELEIRLPRRGDKRHPDPGLQDADHSDPRRGLGESGETAVEWG